MTRGEGLVGVDPVRAGEITVGCGVTATKEALVAQLKELSDRLAAWCAPMAVDEVHVSLRFERGRYDEPWHNAVPELRCTGLKRGLDAVTFAASSIGQARLCSECAWSDVMVLHERVLGAMGFAELSWTLRAAAAVGDGTASWENCARLVQDTTLVRVGGTEERYQEFIKELVALVAARYHRELLEELHGMTGDETYPHGWSLVEVDQRGRGGQDMLALAVEVHLHGQLVGVVPKVVARALLAQAPGRVIVLACVEVEGPGEVAETAGVLRATGAAESLADALEMARALAD